MCPASWAWARPRNSRECSSQEKRRELRRCDRFERGMLAAIPLVRINGCCAPRTPNTSNLLLPHVGAEALVIALDLKGIACSAGAACSSGTVEPSHVLTAIGLPMPDAHASVRFSLGRYTTDDDLAYALDVIPPVVQRGAASTRNGGTRRWHDDSRSKGTRADRRGDERRRGQFHGGGDSLRARRVRDRADDAAMGSAPIAGVAPFGHGAAALLFARRCL